jgi:ADP-ribosylglycohydrolase
MGRGAIDRDPAPLFDDVIDRCPEGPTRKGIERARELPLTCDVWTAVAELGNGTMVSAPDTVPLCAWCAARHLDDFTEAMWTTVAGLGDRDTTCAIVGGIVALGVGRSALPVDLLAAREPLPTI